MRFIMFAVITITSLVLLSTTVTFALTIANVRNDIAVGFGLVFIAALLMLEIKFLLWLWGKKF